MSRLDLLRDAQRPKMCARAMFQGPQGSGKTWTMLSIARLLAGAEGRTIMFDTERESGLTYADVFNFKHLPWRAPYDPAELTTTLDMLATKGVPSLSIPPVVADDVLVIDSASHFWQGSGGILDIANGRVQGGWDKARPIQNALVEQILAMPCHVLLGARMKNSVLVSDNGKTVESIGLTVIQDDSLAYELNIVVQLDMQHSITVLKSRTPAVPVGRLYPGGMEGKLATDYAEWLAGGIPPANREDVEAIVAVFAGITDQVARRALKDAFVEAFGMPHSLTAPQVPEALAWLAEQNAPVGQGPPATEQPPTGPSEASEATEAPEASDTPTEPSEAPEVAPEPVVEPDPEVTPDVPPTDEALRAQKLNEIAQMDRAALVQFLNGYGLNTRGSTRELRDRLADHISKEPAPDQPELVAAE